MNKTLKIGINSNMLKTIALIAMVIDHIGFYFMPFLPSTIYSVCRMIGRIAMPIFVYLLVQGFFHTKDFKKYLIRILICAIITQLAITGMVFVNLRYVKYYTAAKLIYTEGNILFTFAICLITLKIIHEDILIKKWDYHKNMSLKVLIIAGIILACVFIPLDYAIQALLLSILLYFIERFKIYVYINRNRQTNIKGVMFNLVNESTIKKIYIGLVFLSLVIINVYFYTNWYLVLAILPIALYNGEKGSNTKFMKYIYYIVFPLQHIVIYSIALIIMLT